MMARPHYVVIALLLLAEVPGLGEGVSNPGFVARVTRTGLKYARQHGIATLRKELSTIKLPDLSGNIHILLMGNVSYELNSLSIHSFKLRNSDLSLHPRQGVRVFLYNNYASVSGSWKVQAFITLQGTFNLSVDSISIFISLNLGKDQSGRPTASMAHCNSSIGSVGIHTSGDLSWFVDLFQETIESILESVLNQKKTLGTEVGPPYVRGQPKWDSEQMLIGLARLYPNMELELEMAPESAPFLMFTPGNVTLVPVMNIQVFVLLPNSSDRKPLFQLRVRTNVSATISVSSGRISGSLTPGSKLKLELTHSNIGFFKLTLMETIFNYYSTYLIYPSLNAKLKTGFPLPLPADLSLNNLKLQIYKNFMFLEAKI